jgi:glycerol uptake facilitator-like aquaporin
MTELPTLFPELPSPWGWNASETRPLNPAVTIAALTNSFSGIAPADVPVFIVAQLAGALAGVA